MLVPPRTHWLENESMDGWADTRILLKTGCTELGLTRGAGGAVVALGCAGWAHASDPTGGTARAGWPGKTDVARWRSTVRPLRSSRTDGDGGSGRAVVACGAGVLCCRRGASGAVIAGGSARCDDDEVPGNNVHAPRRVLNECVRNCG